MSVTHDLFADLSALLRHRDAADLRLWVTMTKEKSKLPTADQLRFAAKTMAYRLAEVNAIDPGAVRHMLDTLYDKTCFVVIEDETHAVVVYDHDPEVTFSIMNRPGRLQSLPEQTK